MLLLFCKRVKLVELLSKNCYNKYEHGGSYMLFIYICIGILNFIYFFIKLLPTNKDKIVFISRQSDKMTLDYRLIINDLKKRYPNYKVKVITRRIEKNYKDVFLKNTTLIFKQMYHLATSKICVIDGYNIAVSVLRHKKNLKVFQIWHSLGAIKKFGHQTIQTKKKQKFAKTLKMHQKYDYILSSSKAMNESYSKAFNCDENRIYNISLPRVDYLINNHNKIKNEIFKKYPNLKNKKNILYAPTFRDNNHYEIDNLINSIDFTKYNLIIKLHPCTKCASDYSKYNIEGFSAFKLLSVADYVITDYSGFSIESMILNKPTYIYAYDYDEYSRENGLNIDLKKEFKSYFFEDAKSLYNSINNETLDLVLINKLRKKYISDTSGKTTERLVDFIIKNGGVNEKIKNYDIKFFKASSHCSCNTEKD